MKINKRTLSKYLLMVVFFAIVGFIAWWKFYDNRVLFTCVGGFSSEVKYDDLTIKNVSNVSISFFNDRKVFLAIDGSVTEDNKRYHLSRELWFRWRPVDLANGILSANLIDIKRTGKDNVIDNNVNFFILGAEKNGRIFRLWRLNNNVLLVGNAYSPVLSCTIIS